ncbi:class I SAM-dependent methyltransferase [Rickettsiella endosymbiont of Miltochrista miniata]|uniref:class I SAM-dependent methyltransferase n=1 Tax=Rickettsiella endosymbiont of Miltochrista miniata TaxID=3066239 RepID=UPI00313C8AB0
MFKQKWNPIVYTQCSDFQYHAAIHFLTTCGLNSNESILDIGCGNGKTTYYLASQITSGKVMGIDKSADMIEFANEHFKLKNLDFRINDVLSFKHESKFEAAVSFFCMPWITDKALAFKNIATALKDEAKIFILAAVYEKIQAELITNLTQKPHWIQFFENYLSPFIYLNDTKYDSYAKAAGIEIDLMEKISIPHTFKTREEFHKFYLTLVPHITHLKQEDLKNAFADELLEDYFKAKGNKECNVTIEAIKFSGKKLAVSENLTPSQRLAFFKPPTTNMEDECNDEKMRAKRYMGA